MFCNEVHYISLPWCYPTQSTHNIISAFVKIRARLSYHTHEVDKPRCFSQCSLLISATRPILQWQRKYIMFLSGQFAVLRETRNLMMRGDTYNLQFILVHNTVQIHKKNLEEMKISERRLETWEEVIALRNQSAQQRQTNTKLTFLVKGSIYVNQNADLRIRIRFSFLINELI